MTDIANRGSLTAIFGLVVSRSHRVPTLNRCTSHLCKLPFPLTAVRKSSNSTTLELSPTLGNEITQKRHQSSRIFPSRFYLVQPFVWLVQHHEERRLKNSLPEEATYVPTNQRTSGHPTL